MLKGMSDPMNNSANRKGQAAMEFLATYSWAILSIMFVISIIIFAGYFSLSRYQSSECRIHPDFQCKIPVAYYDGDTLHVKTNVTNGLGFNITIIGLDAREVDHGYGADSFGVIPTLLEPGESFIFDARFERPGFQDQVLTVYVTIRYKDELGVEHLASGRIRTRVE